MRWQIRANPGKLVEEKIFKDGRYDERKCNLLLHDRLQIRAMNLPPNPSSQIPVICYGLAFCYSDVSYHKTDDRTHERELLTASGSVGNS